MTIRIEDHTTLTDHNITRIHSLEELDLVTRSLLVTFVITVRLMAIALKGVSGYMDSHQVLQVSKLIKELQQLPILKKALMMTWLNTRISFIQSIEKQVNHNLNLVFSLQINALSY